MTTFSLDSVGFADSELDSVPYDKFPRFIAD